MTTEKKSENTSPTDNKAIFGPLGKYAVIAVIMVSIIVTTAIMLDKQLSTVDEQIAVIEADIAKSRNENTAPAEIIASTKTELATDETAATEDSTIQSESEVALKAEVTAEAPIADVFITTEAETAAVVAETQIETEQSIEAANTATEENVNVELASIESVSTELAIDTDTATLAQSSADLSPTKMDETRDEARQARIDAFKQDQKKHMTEIFARVKALESKQLDRYKTSQSNQVSRLREQVTQQQQMIDALILRNKDLFELRAANAQRNQSNREQMLNRI